MTHHQSDLLQKLFVPPLLGAVTYVYGRLEGSSHGQGFGMFVRVFSVWSIGIFYVVAFLKELSRWDSVVPLLLGGAWTLLVGYYVHKQIS